jgi:hypothetical protein
VFKVIRSEGCDVKIFPGKIVINCTSKNWRAPTFRKWNVQFSPHRLRTFSTDICTVKFKGKRARQDMTTMPSFLLPTYLPQVHSCLFVYRTSNTADVVHWRITPSNELFVGFGMVWLLKNVSLSSQLVLLVPIYREKEK